MALLSAQVRGVSAASLDALAAAHPAGPFAADVRRNAFARYQESPAFQPVRPSRYWKHDLAKLQVGDARIVAPALQVDASAAVRMTPFSEMEQQPDPAEGREDRFASLAVAFANGGVQLAIGAGKNVADTPIVLDYHFAEGAGFPYTLVHIGAGASATVIERIGGDAGAFGCGLVEVALEDGAALTYIVEQSAGPMRLLMTRRGRAGANASLRFGIAELGAALSVNRTSLQATGAGANLETTAIFFAAGDEHVDLGTEVRHTTGHTTSNTMVRSAALGRGQGRYFGNIAIAAHANGCDAMLRDDALLLSKTAHIDSVPALEIASNDVKAFHGATVGSIDEEELFYAQSRGIPRREAERMIALGFFEPAIARFPGEALRERLREGVAGKLELT